MASSNSSIPNILVGKWGYYVGVNPVKLIVINADGSGNLVDLNDGKWSIIGNTIEFRTFNLDNPFLVQHNIQ